MRTAESVEVDTRAARAPKRGVAFQPRRRFAIDGGPVPGTRIGLAHHAEADLEEVARRMRAAAT